MRPIEAIEALEPLTSTTPGWTDEIIDLYARHFSQLSNPTVLRAASMLLMATWTANRRPPIGIIAEAYGAELRKRQSVGEPEPSCVVCQGTSYIEVTDDRRHASWCDDNYRAFVMATSPLHDCGCSAVAPCPACSTGDPGPGRIYARTDVDRDGYSYTRTPPFLEGIDVARRNHEAECRRQGREPDVTFFDRAIRKALGRAGE
jgi:hypothetical protein